MQNRESAATCAPGFVSANGARGLLPTNLVVNMEKGLFSPLKKKQLYVSMSREHPIVVQPQSDPPQVVR